jgi:hypothetical protein
VVNNAKGTKDMIIVITIGIILCFCAKIEVCLLEQLPLATRIVRFVQYQLAGPGQGYS